MNNIGLDEEHVSCFNQIMNQIFLTKKIQELGKLILNGKEVQIQSAEDKENDLYRADMKSQFQKLRDRGLSIRIVTL